MVTLIITRKYPKIDSAVFGLPVGTENLNKQYQIVARTKNAVAGSIALSAALAIVSQTVRNALGASPAEVYMVKVLMGIVMDLIFIVVQFWSGVISAFSKIQTEEVTPYVNRNEILKGYLFWKNPTEYDKFAKWVSQLETAETKTKGL